MDSIDAYPPDRDLDTISILVGCCWPTVSMSRFEHRFEIDSCDSATFNHVFDQRPNDSMTDSN